jgi:hypothetical protein
MRFRDWQDSLDDVVESNAEPAGWRAVGGDRAGGIGEDLYVGHPRVGVFQLKTYAKNPYEVQGVGSKVARRIDDELDPLFPSKDDSPGHFGVQQPVEDEDTAEELQARAEKGGKTVRFEHHLSERQIEVLRAGGIINWMKQRRRDK